MMKHYRLLVGWFLRKCYRYVIACVRTLLQGTSLDREGENKSYLYPPNFQDFIRINSAVWNSRSPRVSERKGEYILVEGLMSHPSYLLRNALIAGYLAHETGLPIIALLSCRTEHKSKKLFESYGVKDFLFLSDRKPRMLDMLRCSLLATRLVWGMSGGDDLLALELDGIDLGRLVYDTFIISTGNGTIENISPLIFKMLVDALHYRCYCDQLFEQYKFPIVVQSEKNYTKWGILSQIALKHGAVIYYPRGGPTRLTLRRYDDLKQIRSSPFRLTQEIFEYVYEHYRQEAIAIADAHMQRRFSGRATLNDSADAQLAFSEERRVVSREELCRQFGWSVDKPIVCILSHVFIDAPHDNSWWLFRDYLTWLRYTLQSICAIDHVNWLVKAHPFEKHYGKSKQTAHGEYEALTADCKHIRVMPKDVNTRALLDIASAILTVCGTSGIEFSCFGIPCVLTGEAPYSGFGFTIEPKSQEEYFTLLKNIHTLEPLNGSQVERAKVAAYIYLELSKVESQIIPNLPFFSDYDEEAIWKEAANRVREYDPFKDRVYQMIQIQMARKYTRLLNYDWIGWA